MEKTKILLVWDEKQGNFRKIFLTPALKQSVKGEEYYIAAPWFGEWL